MAYDLGYKSREAMLDDLTNQEYLDWWELRHRVGFGSVRDSLNAAILPYWLSVMFAGDKDHPSLESLSLDAIMLTKEPQNMPSKEEIQAVVDSVLSGESITLKPSPKKVRAVRRQSILARDYPNPTLGN